MVYLANWDDLHRESVLVIVSGVLLVVADQLLVSAVAHWHNALQEVQKSLAMTALAEKEVHTLQTCRLDVHTEVDIRQPTTS